MVPLLHGIEEKQMTGLVRWAGSLLAVAFMVVWSSTAWGHAVLLGSNPAADQQLAASPSEIVLNFNENVGPIFIRVLDLQGQDAGAPGDWVVSGNDVTLPLTEELPNGTYLLTYRVISADTHPVGATLVFSVGEPIQDMSQMDVATDSTTAWTYAVAANRVALYISVALALGTALFMLWMTIPAEAAPILRAQGGSMSIVAVVTYILSIGFGGAEMLTGGFGTLFSPGTWVAGASSTLGISALAGIPGALILFKATKSTEKPSLPMLLTGATLMTASFIVTGHAATAPPVWLMAPVVAVHLICASFWFASLRPLMAVANTAPVDVSGKTMIEFSTRAVWIVIALAISGGVTTFIQVGGDYSTMITTDYGLRLTAKGVMFLIILNIAAYNKLVMTPALEKGDEGAGAKLGKIIRLEYAAMVAVFALAVSLTLPTPPRALLDQGAAAAMAEDAKVTATATARNVTVDVELTPGRTGENMAMFMISDADGAPLAVERVDTIWSLPAAGLAGIERDTEQVSPTMYHLTTSDLILSGDWNIRISVFIDDFTKVNMDAVVTIK